MRFCYADPPYLGLAEKFYGKLHPEAAEYDKPEKHQWLIDRLCDEFPDGWAMSLHTPTLRTILPMCPEDCRVGAWVKPFASFKKGVRVAYAWEPVIFRGGRRRPQEVDTVRDWIAANIALERGFRGAKPDGFAFWIFEILGMQPDDEFVDMFPGSGSVTRAWESWRRQQSMFTPSAVPLQASICD